MQKSRIRQRERDDAPVGEVDLHGAGGAVLLQAGVRHAVDKELVRPRVEALDGVIPVVGMQLEIVRHDGPGAAALDFAG